MLELQIISEFGFSIKKKYIYSVVLTQEEKNIYFYLEQLLFINHLDPNKRFIDHQ